MSKTRAYSDTTKAIMRRFYDAVEACRANHLITTISDYCQEYHIDRGHFYAQRKNLSKGFFEVGWMSPLVEKCGVSALWLLTGLGTMFGR